MMRNTPHGSMNCLELAHSFLQSSPIAETPMFENPMFENPMFENPMVKHPMPDKSDEAQ